MADKNYYWLKLMKDFFTQPKIKKLRKIAGGDTYTIIYLKMQLLSLDNEAIINFNHVEDTIEEEIALTIDEDVENVQVTISYLLAKGLMEQISENQYLMAETLTLIGSESDVARRVRKHRESKKLLQCNTDVTKCNTEIEKELDTELELKKDKKETYTSILDSYTENTDLKSSLNDFVEMRKKMKGYTTKALKLNLNTLDKLATNDSEKIEIVNKSVENGWKSFYELKNKKEEQTFNITKFDL